MTDTTLHARIDLERADAPFTVVFRSRGRRSDPLAPYISTTETDIDAPQYKPGGRRYTTVQIAIPGGPHQISVLLEFAFVETIDELISMLGDARERLAERFTAADFFEDGDA